VPVEQDPPKAIKRACRIRTSVKIVLQEDLSFIQFSASDAMIDPREEERFVVAWTRSNSLDHVSRETGIAFAL
jgi:hypothetical protein